MEMQQVRYFLAVARTLNFTRAAEECNVTQPALTRAVKQLEDEFGGELIRREGRNSHLTELGNRMQPLLQQCYDSALSAKMLATKIKKGEVPSLALAVSQTLEVDVILGALSEMQRSFPGIQLKLRRGTGYEIGEMLRSGEVELALGGPIGETWDRLEAWPMFSETFDLVVGAAHQLAMSNQMELDVELVQGEQFLVHKGTDPAEFDAGKLDQAGISLDNAHQVDSARDLEALVVAQFGVALVWGSALHSREVKHLNLSALDLKRTVAIYSAAGRQRSREAAAFLNLIRSTDWLSLIGAEAIERA
jgi:DNA-binding transcriptional LysR family regulator